MDVIVDIDGTIADCTHRLHWIQSKPKNWKAFFSQLEDDAPIMPVIQIVKSLYFTGHRIIFVSARNEECREGSEKWIAKHVGIIPKILLMRKNNDHRDDSIVKKEILDKLREDGYDPVIAFDDRKRVCDMWRENGIICAHVAEGNF